MYNSKLENLSVEKIKALSIDELITLSSEIRQAIIDITSIHGGHLSSNLGVVEITLAAYYVFDVPKDVIIFDVSHQTYTEKIITGRYQELYNGLREKDGVSGFSSKKESLYDAFEGGHSSTSISAGLGFLLAKKYHQDIGNVISIIGDASISNGLAFEGLNLLGDLKNQKMIVIINDNNMSVSKNVGSLAGSFNKLRINKGLKIFKKLFSSKFKTKIQARIYKNKLFTSLGLKYFENINGHNLKDLIAYFTYAASYPHSIVLHCKTIKGKSLPQAEQDKIGRYHSVNSFTYDVLTNQITLPEADERLIFGKAFSKAIINYLDHKLPMMVLNPGMIYGCGLEEVASKYPSNIIDSGIAEENVVEIASGLASADSNIIPIVSCYATFLQRAWDEIFHDTARINAHVIFLIDHAGIVAKDGSTHQGIYDLAMFNSIPNMQVLSILNPHDAKEVLDFAIKLNGPVVIRYPYQTKSEYLNINIGIDYNQKQQIIRESNNHKYFITYGVDLYELLTCEKYNDYGIIVCNTINLFDDTLFNNLNNITLITYEQVIYNNSMSCLLLSYLYQNNLLTKIKLIINTLPNTYLEIGTVDEIKKDYLLDLNSLKVGE